MIQLYKEPKYLTASGSPYAQVNNPIEILALSVLGIGACSLALTSPPGQTLTLWTWLAERLLVPCHLLIIYVDSQSEGALNFLLGSGSNENKSQ